MAINQYNGSNNGAVLKNVLSAIDTLASMGIVKTPSGAKAQADADLENMKIKEAQALADSNSQESAIARESHKGFIDATKGYRADGGNALLSVINGAKAEGPVTADGRAPEGSIAPASAAQIAQLKENPLEKLINTKLSHQNSGGGELGQLIKVAQLQKLQNEQAARDFAKTPEGRMKNLSAEQKARFDNAKLGLVSTQGMEEALAAGDNTFRLPLTGDNDFTQQRALFEEALGRMQSGGAIGVEEAKRFKAMAPTAFDSKEIQLKKLAQLKSEMESRLKTVGFSPQEAGIGAGQQIAGNSPLEKAGVAKGPGGAPAGAKAAQNTPWTNLDNGKPPVKIQHNKALNKTRYIFSNGAIEEVDGLK